MFSNEDYNEKIEAYLKGNLSTEDKIAFESSLASDPSLKSEFLFQESLISNIQLSRKTELKARLNNIQIPAAKPVYWRYAALAGFISAVVVSIYYIPTTVFQSSKSDIKIANSDKLENLGGVTETPDQSDESLIKTEEFPSPVTDTKENETAKLKSVSKSAPKTSKEGETGKEILPNLPEIHSPESAGHDHVGKEVETPDHSLTKSKHISATVAGVEVVKSKKHKFHYQYFDTKLFLYGDFETKTYDILELNNSKGQKLYLKFENNYYELQPDKTEISKLEQVKSKETLKELEEIQKK